LTIPWAWPRGETWAHSSDLENAAANDGNLRGQEGFEHGAHVQATAAWWNQATRHWRLGLVGRD